MHKIIYAAVATVSLGLSGQAMASSSSLQQGNYQAHIEQLAQQQRAAHLARNEQNQPSNMKAHPGYLARNEQNQPSNMSSHPTYLS